MAASMLRRRQLKFAKCFQYIHVRHGYIVLIPEVPDDTPESNPLLRTTELPDYKQLTVEKCVNAVGKLALEFETGICRLEESLQEPDTNKTFESIVGPIERLSAPLDYAWSVMKNLTFVKHSDSIGNAYKMIHPTVQQARASRFQSLPIYNALQEIRSDQENLSESQKRVVNKYLLEARLNGIELKGYDSAHFSTARRKIEKEKERFRQKLQEATKRFSHIIADPNILRDFPERLVRLMAVDPTNPTRGPWKITLHPLLYQPFLQYCSDRDQRWNVWNAYNTRCSMYGGSEISNSLHIEEIRFQRRDEAKLLGFQTYADLSMETKMAGSVENVQAMIASMEVRSQPAMEEELARLQEFAASRGFDGKLALWDVPYWRRKQWHSTFKINDDNLRSYFPFPKVLEGLFKTTNQLFGISIKESNKSHVWHEDVSMYEVYDESGKQIASFFLDPYMRPKDKMSSKAWMETGRTTLGGLFIILPLPIIKVKCWDNSLKGDDDFEGPGRCDAIGAQPLVYLTFNFPPPLYGKPSLLHFDEVVILFFKFGHALQHMLTTVPYSEVSGLNNMEWDTVDVCSHFMTMWLYTPHGINVVSSHVDTGEPIPEDLVTNLIQARAHMKGFDITYHLYLSALDLEIYTKKDFWLDITRRLWPEFMSLPQEKHDSHVNSFSEIICDEYPAAYFSHLWAEMIAADIFSAFEEGMDITHMQSVGSRLRETFLSFGGGCHPGELFRRFRGRDPSPDSLLKMYNLQK